MDTMQGEVGPTSVNDFDRAFARVSFGDWGRFWLGIRPQGLPHRLWKQIERNMLDTSVRSMWYMSALTAMAFVSMIVLIVPLDERSGQLWLAGGIITWILLAVCVAIVEPLRRSGELTRSHYVVAAAPYTIWGSAVWGFLPLAVGSDNSDHFYLSIAVCTAGIMIAYFCTIGVWPLSIASCTSIMAATVYSYDRGGGPDLGLAIGLCVVMLGTLSMISFGATVALVRARYETVVAAERKETIQLLVSEYEEGGHDWFWEADEQLRLVNTPPKMLAASHGDQRVRDGEPLRALLAESPDAIDALVHRQPFRVEVEVSGPGGDGRLRLWARPDHVLGEGGYRGVGTDLGAERLRLARELESTRLEAMVAVTAGITHDFNNQLATILGSVELADAALEQTPGSRHHLGRAIDACLRSRRMIADLSAALGIGTPPESSPFRVSDVVDGVITEVNLQYPDASIGRTGMGDVWGFADQGQYRRAVRSLVENACEANARHADSDNTVTVHIGVGVSLVGGPVVELSVDDDGAGVSVAERNRIFEPYYTRWSDAGRPGLGLAVAKAFARQANGRLILRESGAGASFLLEIPRALMDQEPDEPAPTASINELVLAERLSGTFLVVEDDKNLATTLTQYLQVFGASVETVETVAEGVEKVSVNDTYKCVVSDLVLPDGEGYEVIEVLRRHRMDAPVVYVSGYSRTLPNAVAPHLRAPLVPKPFSAPELLSALRSVGVVDRIVSPRSPTENS